MNNTKRSEKEIYTSKTWKTYFGFPGVICLFFVSFIINAQKNPTVQLTWLGEKAPSIATGVSWGVPFGIGQVQPQSAYLLTDSNDNSMPVQSWPLAYWPDGSLKWVGLSTVVGPTSGLTFQLQAVKKATATQASQKIQLTSTKDAIVIDTGILQCEIPKQGNEFISSLKLNNKEISSGGKLVCIKQNGPETETGNQPAKEAFTGTISKVTVEQNGPVRCVLKIEGNHQADNGDQAWLPFVIRLYFYAGKQSVKMMHTIIYDGDQYTDFIRGLGVHFDLPMDEELYNRHIRFSGENKGLWDEPSQPLTGRKSLSISGAYYPKQLLGKRIPNREAFDENQQFLVDHWASWNDFKLMQDNAKSFRIQKRTNNQSVWLDAGAGNRSRGMVFAGDVSGGLTLCVRNFWESYPASLEVRNLKKDKAQLKAWLWSPDGPAMDMRPYDTIPTGHNLIASYEDAQAGHSTPTGIARTSELLLFASKNVPSYKTLNTITDLANQPALLTASPKYMHSIPVFGAWSLPDRSTNGKQWIEDQLDNAFSYYQKEVDQRNWYGFWNYGDVMHGYDKDRHVWRYDIGGYAWDNTELMTNMWLWYHYLRTGKQDAFRMAEAMTRHTGEVDVYHMGKFNGLGSRHNVLHWGGGAKEVRISQSALSRFYYYLTTDERTGDLMHEVVDASNKAMGDYDPLRLILEKSKYPTHARMGPDWMALVGNWMTEWERTGDETYRDKIMAGVHSLYKMPYGLYSGKVAAMGYDPATYKLYQLDKKDIGFSHLSILMGGPEVIFELTPLLASKKWNKLWLQFCKLYGQPVESIEKEFGRSVQLGEADKWYARIPAYYAKATGKKEWADKAWDDFLRKSNRRKEYTHFNMKRNDSAELLEPIYEVEGVSTNNTAQWGLNAIQLLDMIPEYIPEHHPRFQTNEQTKK